MEEILNYKYGLKEYVRLIISFFGSLVFLTTFQYTFLFMKGVVDAIFSTSYLLAVLQHLGFSAIVGLMLIVPYKFLGKITPKLGFKVVFVSLGILLALETLLVGYFLTSLRVLGTDLLGYSLNELTQTVLQSGGIPIWMILGCACLQLVLFGAYRLSKKYYNIVGDMFPFTIILFTLSVMTFFVDAKPIGVNKTKHLVASLSNYDQEVENYIPDEEYPLLRKDTSKDVLGENLNLNTEKPNIVFLIVEGLGADFMGTEGEFGGFTPFLDSLETKSMHWNNFLSTTGRSFGAVPSIMGSLPFGKAGFTNIEEPINRNSLFGSLKRNGYYTSFYQGTNSSFDNLDNFLKAEKVDFVLDRSGFGEGYTLQPKDKMGSSWGYPDLELFKKSATIQKPEDRPKLDVYFTISSHEPFLPPNLEKYKQEARAILSRKKVPARTKKIIKGNLDVFSSLLYTDDAIKWFFENYQKNPEYKNTLFFITGDHRLTPIPTKNELSDYHVPLMLFSPMLKKPKRIKSIASHFDIAPSLMSLLKHNYDMQLPDKVAWMGEGLQTKENFEGTKQIPLMRSKHELTDFVNNDQFLSKGKVYGISNGLKLFQIENSDDKEIKSKFKKFVSLNDYVTKKNKIMPPDQAIIKPSVAKFTKKEKIWISSVFNGNDFDDAHKMAQKLAHQKKYEQSKVLCNYILSEVPSHIDSKILLGRIHAWEGDYQKATAILRECVKDFPSYADSYGALLDVYFWSDQNEKAIGLFKSINRNSVKDKNLQNKVKRAYDKIRKVYPQERIASFVNTSLLNQYLNI